MKCFAWLSFDYENKNYDVKWDIAIISKIGNVCSITIKTDVNIPAKIKFQTTIELQTFNTGKASSPDVNGPINCLEMRLLDYGQT